MTGQKFRGGQKFRLTPGTGIASWWFITAGYNLSYWPAAQCLLTLACPYFSNVTPLPRLFEFVEICW